MSQKPRNNNRGYLAPNQKGKESHPDWRGKLNVDGKDWLVSGWFKDVTNDRGETARIINFQLTDPATMPQRSGGQAPAPAPAAPASNQGSGQDQGGGAFDDIFSGSGSSF